MVKDATIMSARAEERSAEAELRISTRSVWSDPIWHLDGLRPGCNRSDFSLDWNFAVPDEGAFGDPPWTAWREAAKVFLWSLNVDPPPGRRHVHDGTLALYGAFRVKSENLGHLFPFIRDLW